MQWRKDRQPCTGTAHRLTHTQPARGIQCQALRTLAVEGASSIVAAPVGTDPREDLTLIHIWAVAARRGEGWRLPGAAPLGLGSPKLSLGRWEETQPASRAGESLGRFGYKEGGSLSQSQRL